MRVALLIQYDGSNYHGWQVQPNESTIQGTIEMALQKVMGTQISIMGSGRTDTGVHAHGQVAHFDILETAIPVHNIGKVINQYLPEDIMVIASQSVVDDFHSRFMANQREYRYNLNTNYDILRRKSHWYVRFPLEFSKLATLSTMIIGSHDFSSFCYAGTETENMVCDIFDAKWLNNADGSLRFHIKADRFLHHMVRMLTGSMIEVARGKWSIDTFIHLLNNPDRQNHAVTAPPTGLTLVKVSYPEAVTPEWLNAKQNLVTPDEQG